MLLQSLPRLPFVCAFDILFRHGGIASGLHKIFPSGTALFEFMESVFGNGPFNEIIRACHLVFSLESPADALFLLHPVDKTIPESVGAWSVAAAHSDAYWILPVRRDLMIRAVRVFLTKGPVYDWLDSSEFSIRRTMQQWVEFAHECITHHRFAARWWREHEWWQSETMGEVILKKVAEEKGRLENSLWRDECRGMMKEKMEKQKMKETLQVVEETSEKTKEETKKKQGNTMQSLKSSQKKKPQVLRLTTDEIALAKANAEQLFIKHTNMVKLVKSTLNKRISTQTFDSGFQTIARLVMTLANKECKRIKWTLKAVFHQAAGDRLGLETWQIERELGRQAYYPVADAVEKLRKLH